MKKTIIWIVIIIIIIGALAWANSSQKAVSTNTEPIKIGATLALSGNLSFIGKSEMNGLIMASEKINNKGGINGRKIELIIEDNQGDAKSAVSGAQKLLNVNNVDVLFSAFTPITKAIAPVVKEKGIPMVYAASDGSITSQSPFFFRDYFDAEQSAVALFKKVKSDGQKSIKVISEQQESCQLFVDAFKKEASLTDVKVGEEAYFQAAEKDFRTHLTKLNLKKDDALLACAYRHSHLVIKNMSELGLIGNQTYQLVAPFLPAANEPIYKQLFSENKAVSTWYGFAEKDNTKGQDDFIKAYKAQFGHDPVPDSAYSYDDLHILANVIGRCLNDKETIDNECFKSEMNKVSYSGVAGRVSFDELGRSNRETLLIQAENNQWKAVK